MPESECNHDDRVVLKAVHDESGWRVQLHLHHEGKCTTLEGYARFPDEPTCHAHGHCLHHALDVALGLGEVQPAVLSQIGN